jgi:probable AcnD-accessory protein PrpF
MSFIRIPAVFMRGGTSKGVFFHARDLPTDRAERDRLLLRIVGSPDPYGVQIDGMGGGSSSTSKVVVLSKSERPGHDVDYDFGAVAIDAPLIDWSGNCGNLSAAVGPFALSQGLVTGPSDGLAVVRIWQVNIGKTIVAHVPMRAGQVCESGDFMLDGVAFPGAEVRLEFEDPAGGDGDGDGDSSGLLFPTGRAVDALSVAGLGTVEATMIDAGNPAVFVDAAVLGLRGTELREQVNGDAALLARAEAIRAAAAVAMGLAPSCELATRERPATPKLAFFARPQAYRASDGRQIGVDSINVLARIFSMGRLHHAMTGTGAVAIAAAAAVPGTVVHRLLPPGHVGGVAFGHPSGVTAVAAEAVQEEGGWAIRRVTLSRSARVLMEGAVRVPA